MTVPLDDGGRLDQYHRLHGVGPQSVEPDPELAVDCDQPGPTRPLTTKNVQLMTRGYVFQFQDRPATQSAGKNRDDGTHELKHAGDITTANPRTLDFSPLAEFSVGTPYAHSASSEHPLTHGRAPHRSGR